MGSLDRHFEVDIFGNFSGPVEAVILQEYGCWSGDVGRPTWYPCLSFA